MATAFAKLDGECVDAILRQLPLLDKFRLRRVCCQWRKKLDQQLKTQTALALFDKPYPLEGGNSSGESGGDGDGCGKHQLCELDILLSDKFENNPEHLATAVRQLPALQHVCIRLLNLEQLDELCQQLCQALPSLCCLELPFSSALPHFVPHYASSLKHVECSYFNEREPLEELLTSCQALQYLYMIGCPEFPAHLLNAASRSLNHVYTMERIIYDDPPPDESPTPGKPPSDLRGLGFVAAQHLPTVVRQHPSLTHLLLEFHGGYCTIAELCKLKKLRNLYLREYNRKKPIDQHLLQALDGCKDLQSLNLQNVNVSDELFEGLPRKCPNIERVYVNNVQMGHFACDQITDRTIKALKEYRSIRSVNIRGPNSIGPGFNKDPVKGKHRLFEVYVALR